jgi:D-alanyl-D-alanine carboxypeptidase/D-alanyl-D-alanine-endopeptidase (penicillin-binding protein 4)
MPQPGENPVLAPFPSNGDGGPTAAGVQRALAPALSTAGLGQTKLVAVYDANSGKLIYQRGQQQAAMPASTNKVLTATAVLTSYGADYRIPTSVVSGNNPADIVLVGGGDPLLQTSPAEDPDAPDAPASLTELARLTANALKAQPNSSAGFTIHYDGSLFNGPRTAPSWPSAYVASNLVSPITALMADGGGTTSPSASATAAFAELLRGQGIKIRAVGGSVQSAATTPIASVRSAPLTTAVAEMLERSDNTTAEVLAHLAGAKRFGAGSFQTGAQAVTSVLTELGVSVKGMSLFDGSGLSRDNRVSPLTLAQAINRTAQNANPQLWGTTYGLPIAGFTGTLDDRFTTASARSGRGEVRAKTGTLTGESSLAGLVTTIDGDLLTFVFNAPTTPDLLAAQNAWDDASAALARCGCQ